MSDVIGRGVIEIAADARQLKASIEDAKKSIRTLGEGQKDISRQARVSIDQYIGKLQQQNATLGKSTRETELFKLAMRGASNEQLRSADAALRLAESHAKNAQTIAALKTGFIALGAAIGTGLVVGAIAIDQLVKKAGNFQDLAEKIGDSAESIASLSVAAAAGGTTMEAIGQASIKLSKNLVGVDDEAEAAGSALKALGINVEEFKKLGAVERFDALAKALNGFADSTAKGDVAVALLGKNGAELLPFFKTLAAEAGRQKILTEEQIRLADEYADKSAISKARIEAYAQAIAIQMLPALNDLKDAFGDLLKGIAGVGNGANELGRNTAIRDFSEIAARSLAFLVDTLDGVVRSFQISGYAIAGFIASTEQFKRLNFRGAIQAAAAAAEDIDKTLNRPLLGNELDKRINARRAAEAEAASFVGPLPPSGAARPKINFSGAAKKGKADNSADQEAKAQLAFDLEQIRKAGDASIGEFSRAERILEARRAAALVQDREYYAAKLSFINLNGQAQEKALQEEIARLQRETFTGENAAKDKIDNDRKIADAQAKLDKARAESVANREVNAIQETAANERVRQTYLDAADAANAYIDSIKRRNEAEIAGIGRGDKFRQQQAGQLEIEARFLEQRRKLEGELRRGQITKDVFDTYLQLAADAYKQETELYRLRTRAINDAQSDWINGAREALQNYYDETRNIAKLTEDAFTNAFKGLEDTLTSFLTTGKLDFKSFAQSVVSDINRIFVKQQITGPLADLIKNGGLLEKAKGVLGGGTIAQQAPAPVVERTIADAITPAEAAASAAADGAAFSASIAASSAEFSTAVIASSTTFAPEILAAATSFSGVVVAAGAEFAATIAASAATSGGSRGAAGLFDAGAAILGSFADGINYIPRTGVYELHQGERVVPASENARGWGSAPMINISQSFAPGTDKRTIQQAAAASGRAVQRELARGTAG